MSAAFAGAGTEPSLAATAEAGRYVSGEELRALSRIQPLRLALVVASEWGLVLASLWLFAQTRHPLVFVLAFLVIGTRQHALINLIHESTHYNVSRNKRWNDWISDVCFAAPVGLETASFRAGHAPHHSHLGDHERDTEKRMWINIRGWRFGWLLLQHFTGLRALRAVLGYAPGAESGERRSRARHAVLVLLTNGALFGYCALLGAPLAYVTLWLFPLFSLALLLVSLLAIVQHQPVSYARLGADRLDVDFDPPLTRNTESAGALERALLAPIGAAYHHEHHLFPSVPHTQLPRLHALLRARGFYGTRPECVGQGYLALLARLVSPRRAGEPAR